MSQAARLNRRPQQEGENVARRRFQKGSVRRRGNVWIGRYLEDVLENGVLRRKHRTITLSLVRGADGKAVTERQAKRLLQPYLDRVNSTSNDFLQPKKTISFSDFSAKWKALILRQKSHQRSSLFRATSKTSFYQLSHTKRFGASRQRAFNLCSRICGTN